MDDFAALQRFVLMTEMTGVYAQARRECEHAVEKQMSGIVFLICATVIVPLWNILHAEPVAARHLKLLRIALVSPQDSQRSK